MRVEVCSVRVEGCSVRVEVCSVRARNNFFTCTVIKLDLSCQIQNLSCPFPWYPCKHLTHQIKCKLNMHSYM